MTSANGTVWTIRTSPFSGPLYSIDWCKDIGMFIALGAPGAGGLRTSLDGTTWVNQSTPGSIYSPYYFSGAWSSELGIFLGSGSWNDEKRITTSIDGVVFKRYECDELISSTNIPHEVIWVEELGEFVILGNTYFVVIRS
jgi:hypothetical protein